MRVNFEVEESWVEHRAPVVRVIETCELGERTRLLGTFDVIMDAAKRHRQRVQHGTS